MFVTAMIYRILYLFIGNVRMHFSDFAGEVTQLPSLFTIKYERAFMLAIFPVVVISPVILHYFAAVHGFIVRFTFFVLRQSL